MQIINNPKKESWSDILKRPTQTVDDIEGVVNEVFQDVQKNGNMAIKKYTERFDGISLENSIVSEEEVLEAIQNVPENLKKAIKQAKTNIEAFHKVQKTERVEVETTNGVLCWQE